MLRRVEQYLVQRPVVWRARIGLERVQVDGIWLLCLRPH